MNFFLNMTFLASSLLPNSIFDHTEALTFYVGPTPKIQKLDSSRNMRQPTVLYFDAPPRSQDSVLRR